MRPVDQRLIQVGGHGGPGLLHHRGEVVPDVRADHGERGGGEPGLHHGLLVGVVEHQELVGDIADRGGGIGGDADLAH